MELNALVVDDSGIMRKMVMRSLSETGLAKFTFIEAKDGLEALNLFDADKTDILFVDWNMPNMNGIDFVKKVRSIQKRNVMVVMITTESTMGKVEEAMDQAKVDCFVVKPFTTEVLQVKLGTLFEKVAAGQKKSGFFSRLAEKVG